LNINRLEVITLIHLISYIIPFLLSGVIFIRIYSKIKDSSESTDSSKNLLIKLSKYGTPLSINTFLNETWKQIQSPLIRLYEPPVTITGFTVSKYYSEISITASSSFSTPLLTSFSSLDAKSEQHQIGQIYNLIFKYSLFVLLLISGILFIFADFFLIFAYDQTYLIHVPIIRFYLLSIIFSALGNIFVPLLNGLNKVKLLPFLTLLNLLIIIPSFIIGLLISGIMGAIIGLIISKAIVFIIQIILSIKIAEIRLNLKRIIYQYISFFTALITAVILEVFIFKTIRMALLQPFNLPIFEYFSFFSALSFLIIYLVLNNLFKIFSRDEIGYLELIISSDKKKNRFLISILNIFKRILCWRRKD
jgi:O-antigen/teichoic acid export membrane protein